MRGNIIHSDKKWNNQQGNRGAQDGKCCVEKRSTIKGVGEARNEKEEHQDQAQEWRMMRGEGVRNEIEDHRKRIV